MSVYIHAQAFSASLKRSLNLSANKHYYYYGYRRAQESPREEVKTLKLLQAQTEQKLDMEHAILSELKLS